jgi:hypothetical protein
MKKKPNAAECPMLVDRRADSEPQLASEMKDKNLIKNNNFKMLLKIYERL